MAGRRILKDEIELIKRLEIEYNKGKVKLLRKDENFLKAIFSIFHNCGERMIISGAQVRWLLDLSEKLVN